ncbi:MAG: hypothetical protein M3Y24_06990 [Acidobacteriota bacterium]|nr:hypothetical protein [Acidobacteriota bacterium]
MSAPPVPSPLDYVGYRRFAFYPPIVHPDPNDWRVGSSSRSAVQVVNVQTGSELWISRQYIGAVSETDSSLIVGLTKALDARAGTIEPRVKRVIEMPSISSASNRLTERNASGGSLRAPVIQIRLESPGHSVLNKALVITCAAAIVLALLAALITSTITF